MPLIESRIYPYSPSLADKLAMRITELVVEQLKESFAEQLGFLGTKNEAIAKEVIGRFAPGWVWVYSEEFKAIVAGKQPKNSEIFGRFDIFLLENALAEKHQDALVNTVAKAARQVLGETQDKPLNLAVANITGNVRMSVPGNPDSLLTAEGVHTFLTDAINQELKSLALAQ
ncbi:hypothetical protein cce_0272 [Crocosphaera subtropica ATCC 51142]|uniref:Uncharacterized protein n=1 Tax=Crocosphaera subtropica (strain ATCC 51142 / BH68) TaxID=43989 RepID=B1X0C2_CROS5|nr:hypothetical protein [Crocosphaera subtropica]ACB49623.1 hypothetical protein cce_0272 [Crocosphaera subtropica ATCC 51142]